MAAKKKRAVTRYRAHTDKNTAAKTSQLIAKLVTSDTAAIESAPPKRKIPMPLKGALDAVGMTEWKRMAELLTSLDLLTDIDTTALLLYCDAYSDFMRAVEELTKTKRDIIKVSKQGGAFRNPWYDVKKKAAQEMYQYLALFGMSPSDRAKLKTPKPVEPGKKSSNPFDEI